MNAVDEQDKELFEDVCNASQFQTYFEEKMQKKKPNMSSHQFNHKKLNSPDGSKSSNF